jgi:hypothetical protein
MSSAAQAKAKANTVGHYLTTPKKGTSYGTLLAKMSHPQPRTPVQVDNSTTNGFEKKQIKQQ